MSLNMNLSDIDLSEIDFNNLNVTFFNVETRQYTKRRSDEEIAFMKFLLPDKAKFTPYDSI